MTDCRPRVSRITLTVEPDNSLWGFPEMLDHMGDVSDAERIEAVIDLINEDFMAMFEDACWHVEFTDREGQET